MQMLTETLFAALISKVLDRLLPGIRNEEIRNKRALARFLLRIVSIIDAYTSECEHLRTLVIEGEGGPDTMIRKGDPLLSSVRRLSNLNQEFAGTLREIDYLKLFDEDFHRALHTTARLEKIRYGPEIRAYQDIGFIDAADLMEVRCSPDASIEFQFPAEYSGTKITVTRPRTYSLRTTEGREQILTFIEEVLDSLQFSYERVCDFLREHFEPWELFPIRKKRASM